MSPVENEQRAFFVLLKGREKEIRVLAETICRPKKGHPYYVLKRQNETVAEFHKDAVSGWRCD
ncbi:MAG: hypothetical protein OXI11_12920 [Gammaproteobacteria bacterium]|nr:hypothetical protein [Gammaproteobacteria bacterium]